MWGKVLIATRLEKQVSSRFLQVWTDLITKGLRDGDGVATIRGLVAHRASNEAARKLLASDCDSLFLLDSDADITPDFLEQFRDYEAGWQYDVLQAFYPRRGWPPRAIWIQQNVLGDTMETFITDPDTVQDVAIAGTHAVLIKRQVFEGLLGENDSDTFEWFWYNRSEQTSEDGCFSQEAIGAGYRVGATTHVKAGHITEVTTDWTTYQQYLDLTGRRPLMHRYHKLSTLIGEFTGEGRELVLAKSLRSSANVREAWEKAPINGLQSVRDFYGSYDNGYLYELCAWNCQPPYEKLIAPLKEIKCKSVLVIGAGVGTEIEYLLQNNNKVVVFEMPGVLRDFLNYRFENDEVYITQANSLAGVKGPFDLIVALDVIEHIHPDEIDEALVHIRRLLGDTGQLYYHNNFGQQEVYPMHYDHTAIFEDWIEGLNNERESAKKLQTRPTRLELQSGNGHRHNATAF